MAGVESVVFKRAEGGEIALDVYPPADAALAGGGAGGVPVVVWIHGGALIMGNRKGMRGALREALAGDSGGERPGLAQVSIDYRLAPETKLPAILEDVVDAFGWVRGEGAARFGFDPARVGVVGHSAGGYLTLMAGVHVSPKPRALVSFFGYGDVAGAWYSRPDPFYCAQPAVEEAVARAAVGRVGSGAVTDGPAARGAFYLYCRQHGLWPREVVGLDPDREPGAFDRYCPARSVQADFPPTLLLHGDADTDVPYEQSVQMAAALEAAGVEHELVTVPGGPHGFDRDATLEDNTPAGAAVAKAHRFLVTHV